MRIICKLEKRALDADYLQVGEEGPRYVLLASETREPYTRICEEEKRLIVCKMQKGL
jgi:hypothetical protein